MSPCGCPPSEAAGELLNHLWYDPDWEHAAPAALAMHPQRDQVLKDLIRRITRGDQLRADLAAIDGCREIRRFLARVARESGEGDWSPDAAEMIGRARLDAVTVRQGDLSPILASDWPASDSLIIESLLGLLADEVNPVKTGELADTITRLCPAAEQRSRALAAVLSPLAAEVGPVTVRDLAGAAARLAVTTEDQARVREVLIALLGRDTDPWSAKEVAGAVAQLCPAAEERTRVLETLLSRLADESNPGEAQHLAEAISLLGPAARGRARAIGALLGLSRGTDVWAAQDLVEAIAVFVPAAEEQARVRETIFGLLAREAHLWHACSLAHAIAQFNPPRRSRPGAGDTARPPRR